MGDIGNHDDDDEEVEDNGANNDNDDHEVENNGYINNKNDDEVMYLVLKSAQYPTIELIKKQLNLNNALPLTLTPYTHTYK